MTEKLGDQVHGDDQDDRIGHETLTENDEISDQYVDENEKLLKLFIGKNIEKFLPIYHAQRDKKKKKPRSYNWIVLLTPLPWLFYRKMFLFGILLLLVPVLIAVLIPSISNLSYAGIAGALCVSANSIYVWFSLRKIRKLKALDLTPDELEERVIAEGGTSVVGAVFGVLIIVSAIAIPFLGIGIASLPQCTDSEVHQLVSSIVENRLTKNGLMSDDIELVNFKSLEVQSSEIAHYCEFAVRSSGGDSDLFLSVTWADQKKGEYQVEIQKNIEALMK